MIINIYRLLPFHISYSIQVFLNEVNIVHFY